jgi:hypothetical protein
MVENGTRNSFKGLNDLVSEEDIIVILPQIVDVIHVAKGSLFGGSYKEAP